MNKLPMLGGLVALALLGGCGNGGHDGGDGRAGSERTPRGPVVRLDQPARGGQAGDQDRASRCRCESAAPRNPSARTETSVSGGTLHIKNKARDWVIRTTRASTVQITLPKLDSLELEGGNDVSVAGLHGGDTKIKAAGAANIIADGQLDELTVRLAGAGHADLSKLAVARRESDCRWRGQRGREPAANRSMRR